MDRKFYPYLAVAAVVILVLVYALIPKPAPVSEIRIDGIQLLNTTETSAVFATKISWNSDIKPTYVTVDVQPVGAPEVIPADDENRNKYHLIRSPQRWINVHTHFEKEGSFEGAYYIEFPAGEKDFVLITKLKNEDTKGDESLAADEQQFSLTGPILATQ